MNIRNIMLFTFCIFISIQIASGDDAEIQSLIRECESKGMEKQQAQALINALALDRQQTLARASSLSNKFERIKIRSEAVKAIDILSSKKLARPIAQGLWSSSYNVKKAALDRLFELKDPKVTDIAIQALEDNIRVRDGSDLATAHEAFVIELVRLLNVLTGSNYQLDIYNDSEIRRKEIVKAAKEKLAKQKEMENSGGMSSQSTNEITGVGIGQGTNEIPSQPSTNGLTK